MSTRTGKSFRGFGAMLAALALLVTFVPAVSAHQNPAGCTTNGLSVNKSAPNYVYDGGTIYYKVTVDNPGGTNCDVDAVTITDTPPTGPSCTIVAGGSYPAGGLTVTFEGPGDPNPVAGATIVACLAYTAPPNNCGAVFTNTITGSGILHGVIHNTVNIDKNISTLVICPSTALTTTSVNPSGSVPPNTNVTVTVTETNNGNTNLTNVSVTGSPCAVWTPVGIYIEPMMPGDAWSYTCTFNVGAGPQFCWSADGNGTDPLNNPVATGPGTPEHQEGCITVSQTFGKTQGFWGNKNGQARLAAAPGGFPVVDIGAGPRFGLIINAAYSLKVLPSQHNACGKGSPLIFSSPGAQTATTDCTLAAGVNLGSLNNAASQTLALSYNILLVTGFSGQTIAGVGCTAYLTGPLTGASTVNDALAYAKSLIGQSYAGGTTTQTQLGAWNALAGCLNREM